MPSWIYQGVITSILATMLIAMSGVALGYLKSADSSWLGPVTYGLVGAASVAALLAASLVLLDLGRRPPRVTVDNIEGNIREWSETFGLGIQKPTGEVPEAVFLLSLELNDGNRVLVFRPKNPERYIVVAGLLTYTPEHVAAIQRMQSTELQQFALAVTSELARLGIGFSIGLPPGVVRIERRIPITGDLTEAQFIATVDLIDNAMILTKNTITSTLAGK